MGGECGGQGDLQIQTIMIEVHFTMACVGVK